MNDRGNLGILCIACVGLVLSALGAGCASESSLSTNPSASATESSVESQAESAPESPKRVVSINPCIDAILKEVADPAQILAISHYSHDARSTSVDLAWARRFASTAGTAEEIVAAKPDLVLATEPAPPHMVKALHRLGVPLVQIAPPASIAESREQIIDIAAHIGQPHRAAPLLAAIDSAIARAQSHATNAPDSRPKTALIWQEGGLVPGANTLAEDLLHTAGYRNASRRYGLAQWDVLPLEQLLAAPPTHIFTLLDDTLGNRAEGQAPTRYPSMHPALRKAAQQHRLTLINYPRQLLNCGGPTIIAALARLTPPHLAAP